MTVLISLDEAAARLGIGKTLLRAHVSHGTIRYVSVGAGSKRRRLMFTLNRMFRRTKSRGSPKALAARFWLCSA